MQVGHAIDAILTQTVVSGRAGGGGDSAQSPLGELGGRDSEQSSLAQTLGDLGEGIRRSLHMRAGVSFQILTL